MIHIFISFLWSGLNEAHCTNEDMKVVMQACFFVLDGSSAERQEMREKAEDWHENVLINRQKETFLIRKLNSL